MQYPLEITPELRETKFDISQLGGMYKFKTLS